MLDNMFILGLGYQFYWQVPNIDTKNNWLQVLAQILQLYFDQIFLIFYRQKERLEILYHLDLL